MRNLDNFDFLEQIAKGFNPVTGEAFPEYDILLKPEVSSRLLKLANDLRREDAEITAKIYNEFQYTDDINDLISVSELVNIGSFYSSISKAITRAKERKIISYTAIQNKVNAYLVDQGILEKVKTSKGGTKFIATDYGKSCGFSVVLEQEKNEIDRSHVCCSEEAQNYILSIMPKILNSKK